MCVILDANLFGKFDEPGNEDMKPLHRWLDNQNGRIVYTNTEKFEEEWKGSKGQNRLNSLRQSGQLKLIRKQEVASRQAALKDELQSDDEHIIALAIEAGAKVLVSSDRALHQDFKNIVGGSIYQTKAHSRLLNKDTCP